MNAAHSGNIAPMWVNLLLVAQGAVEFTLRVVTPDGEPAAGASVRVFDGEPFRRRLRERTAQVTDALGFCRLTPAPDLVEVDWPEHSTGMVGCLGRGHAFLVLRRFVPVRGRVLGPGGGVAGTVVVGRVVELAEFGEHGPWRAPSGPARPEIRWPNARPALSGAAGQFTLHLLEGGDYAVQALGADESPVRRVRAEFASTSDEVELRPTLRLEVMGTVRDGVGAPVPHAKVRVHSGTSEVTTASDVGGRYAVSLIPDGDVQIAASIDQFDLGLGQPQAVELPRGAHAVQFDPRVVAVAPLTVRWSTAAPARVVGDHANMLVRLLGVADAVGPGRPVACRTEGEDLVVPRLPLGRDYVLIPLDQRGLTWTIRDFAPRSAPLLLEPSAADPPRFVHHAVAVNLRYTDGRAVLRAAVSVVDAARVGPIDVREAGPERETRAGRVDITAWPASACRLLVGIDGASATLTAAFDPRGRDQLEVTLAPAAAVRVAVVTTAGRPYPATLSCESANADGQVLVTHGTTDLDGHCLFALGPGEYELIARSTIDGGELGRARVALPGVRAVTVRVAVPPR